MKYIGFLILILMGWSSFGKFEMTFPCEGGQAELNQLKRDVQNYQNYDQEYKASTHLLLAYCQMAVGDPRSALQNFQQAADLGDIEANYWIDNYYLTGGGGWMKRQKAWKKPFGNLKKPFRKSTLFLPIILTPS